MATNRIVMGYDYDPRMDRTDKAITIPESVLEDLKAKLKQQDAMLKKLTGLPLAHATVIAINEDKSVTIVAEGQIAEVEYPDALEIEVGSPVLINGQTKQIVRVAKEPQIGGIGVVKALVNEHLSEVIIDGQNRVVINSTSRPKVGDQVVLSGGNMVIYSVLPQEQGQRFIRETADVQWDHIGGQRAAKDALKEAIVLPALHPDVFKFYGKGFPGGILLFGPPGNGKTMLGKASSTALKKSGASGGFFSIKGPEVLDAYVGETERKIRELFKASRTYKQKTGDPAVIFIDEAEALLTARGNSRGSANFMSGTVVPTFLAEMDGLEESSAIVMLATNKPEQLDPAIARDGRMDRKIEVARPTPEDAAEIIGVHLRGVPTAKTEDAAAIGAAIVEAIYSKTAKTPTGKKLAEIVSGAMLAAIVEHGKSFALQRDLANGKKPTGVTKADMLQAIERIKVENARVTHAEQ